ncbi:hypothetical protein OIU77_013095 [Salix suchowensis]|uniref:Uncharacterized protein n=1 Tax=Salix suchowensis TaxID=1278906 RepID=A0ABQ8ZTD5_9ROSI|nr:hypothetical protein OIU77_013095 [Salix suchowensis]
MDITALIWTHGIILDGYKAANETLARSMSSSLSISRSLALETDNDISALFLENLKGWATQLGILMKFWQSQIILGTNAPKCCIPSRYDFRIAVNQHGLMMSRSSTDDVKMQGTRLCFFILNVVEFIGVLMTLKPFLARKQYRQKHGTNWFSNVIRLNMVLFRHCIDIRKRVIAFTIRVYWDRIHQQSMIRFLKSDRRQLLM